MEIILKEDVVNLGYKNDIVTVKSGYGRNYLIPPRCDWMIWHLSPALSVITVCKVK